MLRDDTPTKIALNGQPADDTRVAAVYRCMLQFDQLKNTDHPDIKFCEQCKQNVFKVNDFDGFEAAVAARGCVWGPVKISGPREQGTTMFFGAVVVDYYEASSSLTWDD